MVCQRMVVLDGCFVVNLSNDDFTAFGSLLLACEDEVAIKNAGVDHGVALDAKCEYVGAAGEEVAVDRDGAFEVLHGENRRTGGNAAYDRNLNRVARGFGGISVLVVVDNFDAAAESGRTVDVALLDEGCKNGTYAVCRRNFKMVADFTHRGRHTIFL